MKKFLERHSQFITNMAYAAIVMTVIGQCVMGVNYYCGQGAYLVANCINCFRDIILHRPRADKIKNFTFLGITIGLILIRALS